MLDADPHDRTKVVSYIRHGYDVISGYVVEENASLDTVGVIPRNKQPVYPRRIYQHRRVAGGHYNPVIPIGVP
jgi:hypothetical protein